MVYILEHISHPVLNSKTSKGGNHVKEVSSQNATSRGNNTYSFQECYIVSICKKGDNYDQYSATLCLTGNMGENSVVNK